MIGAMAILAFDAIRAEEYPQAHLDHYASKAHPVDCDDMRETVELPCVEESTTQESF